MTILDPPGPFFTSLKVIRSDYCLSKDDASFVQVLHTSIVTYGTIGKIGHADFIVNNGIIQKACLDEFLTGKDLRIIHFRNKNVE